MQAVDFGARMYEKLPWDNSNTFVILAIPLLISVAIGLIFGIINGFGVAVLKLHAFIITLGTQLIAVSYTHLDVYKRQQVISLFARYYHAVV